jgi:hypothetical protein
MMNDHKIRLEEANGVISAYVVIQEERDRAKLARWYSTLNLWEWPADLTGKPEGFDELPDVIKGKADQWNGYGSKAFYTSYLCRMILQKIGAKETLKYHHLHNLKRSRLQFEWWWLKRMWTGDWL